MPVKALPGGSLPRRVDVQHPSLDDLYQALDEAVRDAA